MWGGSGAPRLWELASESWLDEMMEHHRQELLELGGGRLLEWQCDYQPVIQTLQCRQMVRKADEQVALRAADAAAQRSHADASWLERWEQLSAERQARIRTVAGDLEEELQRWCQMISEVQLPSVGLEDWWTAHERPNQPHIFPALPPHTSPWRRLLQAAAAPRAADAGAWGSQRCAAVAERVAAAQGALPPQHQELLAELLGRLASGGPSTALGQAADAVLAAQSQPNPDVRTELEDQAARQSVDSLDAKHGPALEALWAQLSGPTGDPLPGRST